MIVSLLVDGRQIVILVAIAVDHLQQQGITTDRRIQRVILGIFIRCMKHQRGELGEGIGTPGRVWSDAGAVVRGQTVLIDDFTIAEDLPAIGSIVLRLGDISDFIRVCI